MKLLAVNGSPRKKWNTAQLLTQVVEGARNTPGGSLTPRPASCA